MTTPAFVLGGYPAGFAVIRSLGARGIPVFGVYCADREFARHSKYLEKTYCSPRPEREEAFVDSWFRCRSCMPEAC